MRVDTTTVEYQTKVQVLRLVAAGKRRAIEWGDIGSSQLVKRMVADRLLVRSVDGWKVSRRGAGVLRIAELVTI